MAQRAVGLDLDQPLRQRAGAGRRHAAVEHQDAGQPVAVLAEIGDRPPPCRSRPANSRGSPGRSRRSASRSAGVHLRISSRMPEITVPGGLKPLPNGESSGACRSSAERPFPEIGRELGVPLPAQRALAPFHRVVARLPVGRGDAEPARQFGQHRMVDAGAALGHEGQAGSARAASRSADAAAHAPRRSRPGRPSWAGKPMHACRSATR